MNVRWTPSAVRDLNGISFYLEREAGISIANRVCRALYNSIQALRSHPYLGRPGKRVNTRELVQGRYVIVYEIKAESVDILRIWHSAQNRT